MKLYFAGIVIQKSILTLDIIIQIVIALFLDPLTARSPASSYIKKYGIDFIWYCSVTGRFKFGDIYFSQNKIIRTACHFLNTRPYLLTGSAPVGIKQKGCDFILYHIAV